MSQHGPRGGGTTSGTGWLPHAVEDALRCPLCQKPLLPAGTALRCAARHSFDRAKQGYVNLLSGAGGTGTADTADMVAAREAFLSAGHYAPLQELLATQAGELCGSVSAPEPLVLDAGAGTGQYLRAVLERVPTAAGLALDASKYALRRAARAHPRAGAAVWDVWRTLPVCTDSVALVLNVFAPRNGAEFRRVLRPDGALLVVTPTVGHLRELVGPLGLLSVDEHKEQRLRHTLSPHFLEPRQMRREVRLKLSHREVDTLVRMGPSARHLDAAVLDGRIATLPEPVEVTVSVTMAALRPRTA